MFTFDDFGTDSTLGGAEDRSMVLASSDNGRSMVLASSDNGRSMVLASSDNGR